VQDGSWIVDQGIFADFKISTGRVGLANNGAIDLNVKATLQDVNFSEIYSNAVNTTGLILNGQPNVVISSCEFHDLVTGLNAKHGSLGATVDIDNTKFEDCGTGVIYDSKVLDFKGCDFYSNTKGLVAKNIQGASEVLNSTFDHNTSIGLELDCINGEYIFIDQSVFSNNPKGIVADNMSYLTIKCSNFLTNIVGIETDGDLNLSYTKTMNTKTGGDCTFHNNTIGMTVNNDLFLDDGHNNFMNQIGAPHYFYILGDVPSTSLNSSNDLPASQNYWDPMPSSLSTAGPNYYQLTANIWGITQTIVLDGSMLTNYNSNCYSLGGGSSTSETLTNDVEILETEAHVYPNPVSRDGIIRLDVGSELVNPTGVVRLYSAVGEKVYERKFIGSQTTVKLSELNLNQGFYQVQVSMEGNEYSSKLMIK
jgi:hypothetical protein